MKGILSAACLVAASLAGVARAAGGPADLVILNGRIHTQDAAHTIVAALAVKDGAIIVTGTNEAVQALAGPRTEVLDVAGRVVLPGFIDAHTHPAESSQDMDKCNLGDRMLGRDELIHAVIACRDQAHGDRRHWFEVVQVNPSGLVLSRADLDSVLATRPMLLSGSDGHTSWANSAALRAAHITAHTPDPPGGHIERGADGSPTGTLRDAACDLAVRARPATTLRFQAAQLARALEQMRAAGITSVQDAAVNEHTMRIYQRLYAAHRLDMRVRASFQLTDLGAPPERVIGEAVAFRDRWAIDPDYLRADAVKIFADGVVEYPSHTAALLAPYLDGDGHPTTDRGPDYYTQDNLDGIVDAADAAGLTVHVHAIGDRAVRSTLDAFAYARAHGHGADNRDQIAHLEMVDPADYPRFAALGVIANFQLLWSIRDPYIERATIPYIGAERAARLYPTRSLLDAGARIAGGSDWNVSSFNVFEALEHAITRSEGRGEPVLLPEQSIPLATAVDAYTINAAYALRQERTTGSLEPGKRADFVVLDRDIYALDPYELHETRVLATYLDGRPVYSSGTLKAAPGPAH